MDKEKTKKLTPRQVKFCLYYIETLNATQAAVKAGYSKIDARNRGSSLLKEESIKNYINTEMELKNKKIIMSADEILERLTKIIRGELEEEIVVIIGDGEGCSHWEKIKKKYSGKEIIRALELLGQRYGLWKGDTFINLEKTIIIKNIPRKDDNK